MPGRVGLLLATLFSLGAWTLAAGVTRPARAQNDPVIFASREVGGSNQDSRLAVDGLDDPWREAAAAAGFGRVVVGSIAESALPVVVYLPGTARVEVSLRDVSEQDLGRPSSVGSAANTQGGADDAQSATMQDGSPKPESLLAQPFYNEGAGTRSDRNALLFTFSEPAVAFGAWFGDLETRTQGGGTAAILRLLGEDGRRLGPDHVIVPSTPDQSLCGAPVDDGFVGCGNKTTLWLGFVAQPTRPVAAMLVVVGDDDTVETSDDGNLEHLSFTGASLALEGAPTATTAPTEPAQPTAPPSATPTSTSEPTSTPRPSETARPSPTAPPSTSSSPTPEPRPLFLPLLLRLECPPAKVDAILVIDTSTSMAAAQPGGPSRLAEAQAAARTFLSLLDLDPDSSGGFLTSDRAAVVWFNGQAAVEEPMSGEWNRLRSAVDRLPERVSEGTRLDLALAAGFEAWIGADPRPENIATLVLLTDGRPNGASDEEVRAQAQRAKDAGLRILTIGLGRADEIDEALLRAIASQSSDYARAPDAADLDQIYRRLASTLRCPAGRWLP